jgi:hypothetical protein
MIQLQLLHQFQSALAVEADVGHDQVRYPFFERGGEFGAGGKGSTGRLRLAKYSAST